MLAGTRIIRCLRLQNSLRRTENHISTSNSFVRIRRCSIRKFYATTSRYGNRNKGEGLDENVLDAPKTIQSSNVLVEQEKTGDYYNAVKILKDAKCVEDVLLFAECNDCQFAPKIIVEILSRCMELHKAGKSKILDRDFLKKPEVIKLCGILKKGITELFPQRVVLLVSVLAHFNVSSNSLLFQASLQQLSQSVNDVELRQLIFLNYLLEKVAPNPLVDALKIALPIVFEANARLKLPRDDFPTMDVCLQYAIRKSSPFTVHMICEALHERREEIYPRTAMAVATVLCLLKKLTPLQRELYQHCANTAAESIMDYKYEEVRLLAKRMITRYVFDTADFYNEKFMASLTPYVVDKKLDFWKSGQIMRLYNKISYPCISLIKYVDEQLSQLVEFGDSVPLVTVISLIHACGNNMYKPPGWTVYEYEIVKYLENNKRSDIPYLRMLLNLLSLDCWCPTLIEFAFSESFLRERLKKDTTDLEKLTLLSLYRAVMTLHPGKLKILPPADIIEECKDYNQNDISEFPLASALEHGLGGKAFVVTNLVTKWGHFIDHLVVMKKDGVPIAVNVETAEKDKRSRPILETLEVPEGSFLFAILLMSPANYVLGVDKLRGQSTLNIRSLESLGLLVIPISPHGWDAMKSYERIPYLMRELRTRLPVDICDPNEASEIMLCVRLREFVNAL